MLNDIATIKRFLANHYNLPLENPNDVSLIRIVGEVPDGEHTIALGSNKTHYKVIVSGNKIYIGEKVKS